MLHITKVFHSGGFQAARLPKDFRFSVDVVEITREGDAVILRPKADAAGRWTSLSAAVNSGFSPDFTADGREQPDEQHRLDLDRVFQ